MIEFIKKKVSVFYLFAFTAMVFGFLLAGCGGDGDSSGGSSYVGRYSGSWHETNYNESGSYLINVAADGQITGFITRNGSDLAGTGQINTEGAFTFSTTNTPVVSISGTITSTESGTTIPDLQVSGDVTGSGDGAEVVSFAVIADPHYYDPALGTTGSAFERATEYDSIMLAESSAIMESAIDDIVTREPQFVIMIGDLTRYGAESSHTKLIQAISRFETNGIQVYVTPGGRDINSPRARSFSGDSSTPVDSVTESEFATMYGAYGFNQAISRDPNSLSYVVEAANGLWLMCIDTPYHGPEPDPGLSDSVRSDGLSLKGNISEETATWIAAQMAQAETQGKTVIAACHQGIIEHFENQYQFNPESVIKDHDSASENLRNLGLALVFTGAFHANDVALDQVSGSREFTSGTATGFNLFYDVETASLAGYPCSYRMVNLAPSTGFTMLRTYRIENINYNEDDALENINSPFDEPNFQEHALGIITYQVTNIVTDLLTDDFLLSGSDPYLSAGVDTLIAHFVGDEEIGNDLQAQITDWKNNGTANEIRYGTILELIWNTYSPADKNTNFNFLDFWPT